MFIRLCAGHCIQIGKSKRARYVIGLRMSPHVRIHLPRHTQRPPGARARTHRHSVAHTHMQAKRRGALVGPYCQEAWTLHSFRCAPQMHQKRRNMKCKGDTRTHACMRHATQLCRVDIRNTRHTRRNHYAQAERPGTIHYYACSTYRAYQ